MLSYERAGLHGHQDNVADARKALGFTKDELSWNFDCSSHTLLLLVSNEKRDAEWWAKVMDEVGKQYSEQPQIEDDEATFMLHVAYFVATQS